MSACRAQHRSPPGGAPYPHLHVLIESSAAVHRAFDIAAHPRVQSISFGLMDFVSSHGGAIPAGSAMGRTPNGQFTHPLVLRAKTEIAAACHAYGKVPSHCVVTEFTDTAAMQAAARKASRELGYTRMWSIHPAQIRPILAAFAPSEAEIDDASQIIAAGASVRLGSHRVLKGNCMTVPVTVTFGKCWSAPTRPGALFPLICSIIFNGNCYAQYTIFIELLTTARLGFCGLCLRMRKSAPKAAPRHANPQSRRRHASQRQCRLQPVELDRRANGHCTNRAHRAHCLC